MLFKILTLIPVLCIHQAMGGCSSLEELVSVLPYINSQNFVCVSDDTCSLLNCTSNDKGYQSSLALQISSCDSIHINVHIPKVGIIHWGTSLMDQTEVAIPGFQLPEISPPKQGSLLVGLEKTANNSISLSLVLKGCDTHMGSSCPVIKNVLTRYQLPCNSQKKLCFLNVLDGCSEKETCSQLTPFSQEGVCVCLPGLARGPAGACTSSDPLSNNSSHSDIQPKTDDSSNKNGSSVVAEILVPVLVLALAAAVIIILHRHGLFGWLRNQLPSAGRRGARRFEELSIGADEDDDDPPLP